MNDDQRTVRLGIDVGGTFTDLIAQQANGAIVRIKVPTTPREPERGALAALGALLAEGVAPSAVGLVAHASTIATNALLGQMHLALPRVAFITTAGFRDVIAIGRQNRSAVYDLNVRRPTPLAAREDRFTIAERREADGSVTTPVDLAALDAIAATIRERDIPAVAVGFLHANVDDAHERAVVARLAELLPAVDLCSSADLVREFREYERFSTAVVNAALMPTVRRYLDRFVRGVRDADVTAPVFVMRSDGGMASIATAARRPASLIESGPASGVIAAAYLGAAMGLDRVLSFDMGGTTAKAGTIVDGVPEIATEFEAAGATHSGRALKGSGYPVRFPFIDLAEVSAGGGTIAWVDRAGGLRVGPMSAGADPGPAAYGRGTVPTVTDANVVLGRLNPRALLGGAFPIDAANATRAIDAVAHAVAGDTLAAAAGIVALVDSEMAKVVRIVSVERGYDPRDFTLLAFGGGGPLHACAVAEEIGIRRIVVPPLPGLFSAYGLLAADVRVAFAQTYVATAAADTWAHREPIVAALRTAGEAALAEQTVAPAHRAYVRELDLRYAGQSFELTLPDGDFDGTIAAFHARHEARYGYAARDEAVEIVTVRVIALGATAKPPIPKLQAAAPTPPSAAALAESRDVYDGVAYARTPVYTRDAFVVGTTFAGPAVVEQYDTTTYVGPAWRATVDVFANIVLEADRT
jgi:N-methylhydantoinase A